MNSLQPLAEDVGVSERTLRRAANQGTLRARRPSPRRLDLPLGEREYIRRSWPLLASLKAALRTEPNVRFALLFGSAARGADGPASDLDLLVEMRDESFPRLAALGEKLEALLGRRVDLVLLEDASRYPPLLAEAVTEGRVLVDRAGRWPELHAAAGSLAKQARQSDRRRTREALAGIDRMLAG